MGDARKKAGNAQSLSIFVELTRGCRGCATNTSHRRFFGLAACSITGGTTRATAPRKRIALVRTNDTARGAPCKVTLESYFVRLPRTSLRPYFDSTARFIAAAFLLLAEQAISEQKMALKILRLIGVLDCVGVKKTTLYRWIREGKFPAPVQLGARSVGWRAADVQQWVESRQSTRGQA